MPRRFFIGPFPRGPVPSAGISQPAVDGAINPPHSTWLPGPPPPPPPSTPSSPPPAWPPDERLDPCLRPVVLEPSAPPPPTVTGQAFTPMPHEEGWRGGLAAAWEARVVPRAHSLVSAIERAEGCVLRLCCRWCPCWGRVPLPVRLLCYSTMLVLLILTAYGLALRYSFKMPCTTSQVLRVRAGNRTTTMHLGGHGRHLQERELESTLGLRRSSSRFEDESEEDFSRRRVREGEWDEAGRFAEPEPEDDKPLRTAFRTIASSVLGILGNSSQGGEDGTDTRGITRAIASLPSQPLDSSIRLADEILKALPGNRLDGLASMLDNRTNTEISSRVLSALRFVNESLTHTYVDLNITVRNRNWFPLIVSLSPFELYYWPNTTSAILIGRTEPVHNRRLKKESLTTISLPFVVSFPDKTQVIVDTITTGNLRFEFVGTASGRLTLMKNPVAQRISCAGLLDVLGENSTHSCSPPPPQQC